MMARVNEDKELFERGVQRFGALRTVFAQQTNALFDVIGLEALRANAGRTRRGIERSPFTKGVRNAMADFFTSIRRDFDDAGRRATEIHDMMQAMYARFAAEQPHRRPTIRRRSRCSSTRRRSTGSSARTTSTSTRCGTC